MRDEYVLEVLNKSHDRQGFSCGVEPLDTYFHRQAGQDRDRHLAGVFVLRKANSNEVLGYYTLSSAEVNATVLPNEVLKTLGRYPIFPATLIGRLAVDNRYQDQGIGRLLLMNALERSYHSDIGAALVVVDPLDAAVLPFYTKYGFQELLGHAPRLFITMRTIKKLITGS